LVLIAILVAVAALIATRARQIAALRAMGAPAGFIFSTVWIEIFLILACGTSIGIAAGYGGVFAVAQLAANELAIALPVSLAPSDIVPALAIVTVGLVLAGLPARLAFSRPVAAALKNEG
jgi:putative ABC transport system permease protein